MYWQNRIHAHDLKCLRLMDEDDVKLFIAMVKHAYG